MQFTESLGLLADGIGSLLDIKILVAALLGCLIGTLIGVLPGIGPAGAIAVLIPISFTMGPAASVIMLAAIYYGAMYGGTITSVLINTPGEASSVVTCLDGYKMAQQGRAGAALAVAAIGSFVGAIVATMALVLVAVPLTTLALRFGPAEFFGLILVGLSLVTALAGGSMLRALVAAVFGLLVAMVGIDPVLGTPRLTFGQVGLLDGLGIIPVVMGLFGVSEVLGNVERAATLGSRERVGSLLMSRDEMRRSVGPIIRGTGIGTVMGLVPGIGSIIPTFASYAAEKRLSREPERFGTGMIEGVAGPETANNAYTQSAMIPLLTLGIPASPTIAIIMGGFLMHGLVPGPTLMQEHPDIVWAFIASFLVGNLILVILNLPLIPLWTSILKIPSWLLLPMILLFCIIGAYSLRANVLDIGIMIGFGIIGYIFRKIDIPLSPIALTVVLGPLLERALRQSLEISGGSVDIFLHSPVAMCLIVFALGSVLFSAAGLFRKVQGEDPDA